MTPCGASSTNSRWQGHEIDWPTSPSAAASKRSRLTALLAELLLGQAKKNLTTASHKQALT